MLLWRKTTAEPMWISQKRWRAAFLPPGRASRLFSSLPGPAAAPWGSASWQGWTRRYGAAALDALLEYGFGTLGLHSIWLSVWAGNVPALALYRRAGFREAGRRRDAWRWRGKLYALVYMDLLAEEFFARQKAEGAEGVQAARRPG